MIGDGSNYMKPASHYPLRAVPHRLVLPADDQSVRAWFGRMFFAPNDAVLSESTKETFQSLIEIAVETRRLTNEFPSLGCSFVEPSARRILHDATGHNCSHGTAYCWMSCRSTANLTSCTDEEVECRNSETGALWVDCPTCHDSKSRLVCPSNVKSSSSVELKRDTFGWVMLMALSIALIA
jgi:hypothetical protein